MMYLLLRDNKQSGPYSLDELKVKGLKAYDLVWVEGRSAAWRYPSEIDELSAFAPAVEEQPFDRFFKKPVAAAATEKNGEVALTNLTTTSPSTSSRTIYVTMPGGIAARENGRSAVPARETVRENAPIREIAPARETPPVREAVPVQETMREVTPVRESMPVRERMSYRREPATEILPPLPRRKPTNWLLLAGIGGGVLVLLAVGIFIGLSIHKNPSAPLTNSEGKVNDLGRTTAQQVPVTTATDKTAAAPAGNAGGRNVGGGNAGATNAGGTNAAVTRSANTTHTMALRPKTEATREQQAVTPDATKDSPVVQTTARREAVHRTDVGQNQAADNHEELKATLANEVSVGTNKYEVGTFGGIHNLQVTVTNRSAYSLDVVVVAVSYIQANKKVYKTENLYFRGIGPGSALMLEAPKSPRGISVQYKVTSINSKELGLSEPGT